MAADTLVNSTTPVAALFGWPEEKYSVLQEREAAWMTAGRPRKELFLLTQAGKFMPGYMAAASAIQLWACPLLGPSPREETNERRSLQAWLKAGRPWKELYLLTRLALMLARVAVAFVVQLWAWGRPRLPWLLPTVVRLFRARKLANWLEVRCPARVRGPVRTGLCSWRWSCRGAGAAQGAGG